MKTLFQTRHVGQVSSRSALFAPKTKKNDMFLFQKKKALLQKEKKSRETSYSLFMRTKRETVIQENHLLYSGENYNLRKLVFGGSDQVLHKPAVQSQKMTKVQILCFWN